MRLVQPCDWIGLLVVCLLLAGLVDGDCDEPNSDQTTNSSTSSAVGTNLLTSFRLHPGFRIELVASEPMITSPVAMAFDENGRLFVVEMRDYPDRRASKLGRVRMLENMNEEGVFQNSTIYADTLGWPSAVACYSGGIFVAAAPDLFYFKDTKGDGIADARQLVMTGFGGTNNLDPNLLPNNFNWGPDNRIYGASGGVGGEISPQVGPNRLVSIAGSDFSFDPRTLELTAETGPAESGLSFDSNGRRFVSDFARPLLSPNYPLRYTQRNPYYPRPNGLAIVTDPTVPIFQYNGSPPQPLPGRQPTNIVSAPMTMARGCVVYRGYAFPTNYFDNVFIADPNAHIIHRLVLRDSGPGVVAERATDERNTEFVISTDPSFRPVQLINGPDGALYVADMQDGNERGRIYRILPAKFKRAKLPQLGKAKTYDLVSAMAQGDGWHRDTAARLLYERKDPAAPALLRGTLARARFPQARILAMQELAGAGALTVDDVGRGLSDLDPRVREQAALLSENLFTNGDAPQAVLSQLGSLVDDSSARVRVQLAFTLGQLQRNDKSIALAKLLARNGGDPWMQNAVLSSAANGMGNLFITLAADAGVRSDARGFEFLRRLALMIGVSGHQDAVVQAANFLTRGPLERAQIYALLYELGEGLYRTRSSLGLVDTQGALQQYYSSALDLAADPTQPEAARAAATRLAGVSTLGVGSVADWLLLVCNPPTGPELQSAAVETLSRYDDPKVVNAFLQMWPGLTPLARTRAVTALMSRDTHIPTVLDAIQNGSIPGASLSSEQRNFLRTHPVPALRQRALQLLGPVPVTRPAILERYKPALTLRAAPERGREIFRLRCAQCHVSTEMDRAALGPQLFRARSFTREQLLESIVEPNRTVRADYTTQVMESKEGLKLAGIVTDENNLSVTLKQVGGGVQVWPQGNVRSVEPQSWSLMPEGLEVGLSTQDMADLMEFILRGAR